jgi:hypothetical protein
MTVGWVVDPQFLAPTVLALVLMVLVKFAKLLCDVIELTYMYTQISGKTRLKLEVC